MAMSLKANKLCVSLLSGALLCTLSACGNKGDLVLLPDEMAERELEQLKKSLEETEGDATTETGAESDTEKGTDEPEKKRSTSNQTIDDTGDTAQ